MAKNKKDYGKAVCPYCGRYLTPTTMYGCVVYEPCTCPTAKSVEAYKELKRREEAKSA